MAAPSRSADTRLVVMPGDGIGPEITAATLHVLGAADRAFGLNLAFEEVPVGFAALRQHGTTLPDAAFERAKAASTRRASCASASTSMPMSARPARAQDFRRAAANPSTS
jgi:isocitrate/isopropylmalate dehydrogenase